MVKHQLVIPKTEMEHIVTMSEAFDNLDIALKIYETQKGTKDGHGKGTRISKSI